MLPLAQCCEARIGNPIFQLGKREIRVVMNGACPQTSHLKSVTKRDQNQGPPTQPQVRVGSVTDRKRIVLGIFTCLLPEITRRRVQPARVVGARESERAAGTSMSYGVVLTNSRSGVVLD